MKTRMWLLVGSAGIVAMLLSGCSGMQAGGAGRDGQIMTKVPESDADGGGDSGSHEILPDTHVAAGRLHESQGRLARAAEQYRMAVGIKPDHVEAYNRLGIVLDRLGKYAEADQAFNRAIQVAPKKAFLHNNLAFSYTMQGRWVDAENALTKALQIEPDFARARVNLGMVQAQQGKFEQALGEFRRVLSPEDAYYNLGLMYQSKQLPVEAAQAFRQALASNPKMAAAQKRLELLPPSAVSQATQRGELAFVQAMALTGAVQNVRATPPVAMETLKPSTQPTPVMVEIKPITKPATRPEEVISAPGQSENGSGIRVFDVVVTQPPVGNLMVAQERAWLERDMIPHEVEDETDWSAISPPYDEEAIEPEERRPTRRLAARWNRIREFVRGLRSPLDQLAEELAVRAEPAFASEPPKVLNVVPDGEPSIFDGLPDAPTVK